MHKHQAHCIAHLVLCQMLILLPLRSVPPLPSPLLAPHSSRFVRRCRGQIGQMERVRTRAHGDLKNLLEAHIRRRIAFG